MTHHGEDTEIRGQGKHPDGGRRRSQTGRERVQNQRDCERTVAVGLVDDEAGEVGEGIAKAGVGAVLRDPGAGVSCVRELI